MRAVSQSVSVFLSPVAVGLLPNLNLGYEVLSEGERMRNTYTVSETFYFKV